MHFPKIQHHVGKARSSRVAQDSRLGRHLPLSTPMRFHSSPLFPECFTQRLWLAGWLARLGSSAVHELLLLLLRLFLFRACFIAGVYTIYYTREYSLFSLLHTEERAAAELAGYLLLLYLVSDGCSGV